MKFDPPGYLMNAQNICFYGEIRKIIPKLSSNTHLICSTDFNQTFVSFGIKFKLILLEDKDTLGFVVFFVHSSFLYGLLFFRHL